MPLTKHIRLKPKRIVVFVFLLLNCLLTSAPFVNASILTGPIKATGYPAQHHTSDQEESSPGKHSLEDRMEYNHVVRNKHRLAATISTTKQASCNSSSAFAIQPVNSGFRLRPAYYCLLFLYQLFWLFLFYSVSQLLFDTALYKAISWWPAAIFSLQKKLIYEMP